MGVPGPSGEVVKARSPTPSTISTGKNRGRWKKYWGGVKKKKTLILKK